MQFKREKWELRQMQAMPLRLKIQMTAQRIESWYEYWDSYNIRWEDDGPPGVYLSFSGGKDSTVLRHILKNHCIAVYDCPDVVPTTLELMHNMDAEELAAFLSRTFCQSLGKPQLLEWLNKEVPNETL